MHDGGRGFAPRVALNERTTAVLFKTSSFAIYPVATTDTGVALRTLPKPSLPVALLNSSPIVFIAKTIHISYNGPQITSTRLDRVSNFIPYTEIKDTGQQLDTET